jgi:hypothetical protein
MTHCKLSFGFVTGCKAKDSPSHRNSSLESIVPAATPGEPRVNPSAGWALKTQTPARRLPGRGSIGEGAAGAARFS